VPSQQGFPRRKAGTCCLPAAHRKSHDVKPATGLKRWIIPVQRQAASGSLIQFTLHSSSVQCRRVARSGQADSVPAGHHARTGQIRTVPGATHTSRSSRCDTPEATSCGLAWPYAARSRPSGCRPPVAVLDTVHSSPREIPSTGIGARYDSAHTAGSRQMKPLSFPPPPTLRDEGVRVLHPPALS